MLNIFLGSTTAAIVPQQASSTATFSTTTTPAAFTISVKMLAPVRAGNCLVVMLAQKDAIDFPDITLNSVTDTLGNSFTIEYSNPQPHNSGPGSFLAILPSLPAGGVDTITANLTLFDAIGTGSPVYTMFVAEIQLGATPSVPAGGFLFHSIFGGEGNSPVTKTLTDSHSNTVSITFAGSTGAGGPGTISCINAFDLLAGGVDYLFAWKIDCTGTNVPTADHGYSLAIAANVTPTGGDNIQFFIPPSAVTYTDLSQYALMATSWTKSKNQNWQAQFTLRDIDGTMLATFGRPLAGQPVLIKESLGSPSVTTLHFSGTITQIKEQAYQGSPTPPYQLQFVCTVTGWSGLCDRRVVTTEYPASPTDALQVVQDIVAAVLASDGVSLQIGPTSPLLTVLGTPLVLNPATVTDAFNQLKSMTGADWWIDENRVLNFRGTGTDAADSGISVSDNSRNFLDGTMQVSSDMALFRNQQYAMTTVSLGTIDREETFTADGTTATGWWFITKFGILATPTVKVNGVVQTVFELNVDAYGQNGWYWMKGAPGVQQGQQIPPTAGATIEVDYNGLSENYTIDNNAASIAARAAIEGGSGIWANIDQSATLETADVAHQYGQGLLSNFANPPTVIQFDTYVEAFDTIIGQIVTFALSLHNLFGQWIVTDVSAVEEPGAVAPSPAKGGTMRYTVRLNNMVTLGTYVSFMTNLVAAIKTQAIQAAQTAVVTQPIPANSSGSAALNTAPTIFDEVPSGAVDGVNVTYTLTQTPGPSGSLRLFINGVLQIQGTDYTLSTATITMGSAPSSGSTIVAFYRYSPVTAMSYSYNELPGGTANGSNVTFTLANAPNPFASLELYVNGVLQIQATDYTLSGLTITMGSAPSTGSELSAFYGYNSTLAGNFADNEVPSGTVNGSNVTFTTAKAPNPAADLQLYVNGILQIQGIDYTLSGTTITFGSAPTSGAFLNAWYRY